MYFPTGIIVLTCLAAVTSGAPRIIGGQDAPNHKYPYQVSLQFNGQHFCSGSILNKRWIMTAAHCVEAVPYKYYKIVTGTNKLNQPGKVYDAQTAFTHERYVHFYNYDIGLIRTATDITFSDIVKPIALPARDVIDYNVTAVFSGWGVTNITTGNVPNNLQEIKLKLVTVQECKKKLTNEVNDRHVCTFTKFNEGICFGDSGGPLVLDGEQIGIASFVRPCGVGFPDVYTRVYSYKSWILSKINV